MGVILWYNVFNKIKKGMLIACMLLTDEGRWSKMDEKDLDKALVKHFGIMIYDDLEVIKNKIGAVIAAHKFAGNIGTLPLCKLNRILEEVIKDA